MSAFYRAKQSLVPYSRSGSSRDRSESPRRVNVRKPLLEALESRNLLTSLLYDNGPINGAAGFANALSGGWLETDSFTLSNAADFQFTTIGLWSETPASPVSLAWSIGTTPFGSEISSGAGNLSNTFVMDAGDRQHSIFLSRLDLNGSAPAGSYWLTLHSGTATSRGLDWDVNFGPSTSFQRNSGQTFPVNGHSFQIYGDNAAPDIKINSATTADSKSVSFDYEVTGTLQGGSFQVGVYRSADRNFDTNVDVPIGDLFKVTDTSPGIHSLPIPGRSLTIDPAHPYVLVVADPLDLIVEDDADHFNEDNTASFRKLVLGVVTHGLLPVYGLILDASWVVNMARSLQGASVGYDDAIAFDWSAKSTTPLPNMTQLAGLEMASEIRAHAQALATLPSDVVDVHLIGHSRGSVVISQALLSLQASGGVPQLQAGYKKMTMLDPHPANPATSGFHSASPRVGAFLVRTFNDPFHRVANDPAVVVPSNVHEAEDYYQRTLWSRSADGLSRNLNLWGIDSVSGLSSPPVDLTGRVPGISHITITDWYQANIIPTLILGRSTRAVSAGLRQGGAAGPAAGGTPPSMLTSASTTNSQPAIAFPATDHAIESLVMNPSLVIKRAKKPMRPDPTAAARF